MNNKERLLKQFDWVNKWFTNSLAELSDDETNKRVNANMNHIKYLAGHLLNTQYGLAGVAGVEVERKWDDLFAGLSKTKAQDNFPYPTIEEIKNEWNKLYTTLRDGLAKLTEEELDNDLPGSTMINSGIFNNSKGDYWAFINLHQLYHVGQIGILRRGLGKDAMKLF